MHSMHDLEKFRQSLEQDRMYKVSSTGRNYSHVLPRNMSLKDLQELAERLQRYGEGSLLEQSIVYNSTIFG